MKIAIAAVLAFLIGTALGWFLGRRATEAAWSQPYAQVSPDVEQRSSGNDADPAPKAGTKILTKMPIGRARQALAELTANDPAVSRVTSFGASDDGVELHVVVENRGKCTIKKVAGVAYGFDARGRPAKANKGGENYVAFSGETTIEPGKHDVIAQASKNGQLATLAIAQIDKTTCEDGTTWARP